ncbi:MAG: hypothetical protein IIC73_05165 [Armatimonadetes bacterium]|nr:hypothetical protein [Armatimonadota bacterium]
MRVLTVGLNPSDREFPAPKPFRRFPELTGSSGEDAETYIGTLSSYFQVDPYTQWFGFYEQALSGIGSSYFADVRPSAALHTDIGSCLPTSPTWSGLPDETRRLLASEGVPLWHDLIAYLRPHIVVASIARAWMDLIEFPSVSPWTDIHTFTETGAGEQRKRPITVSARWLDLEASGRALLAYVPAAQKPLATLTHAQKKIAGQRILEAWRAGG